MTRKPRPLAAPDATQTAHTRQIASVSQNSISNADVTQMTERLLWSCVRLGHKNKVACAPERESHHKRRLQTFRQCTGASITYVVGGRAVHLGDGSVCLVVFPTQYRQAPGCTQALPNEYTAAQPEIYTPGRACESDGSAWMPLFPVSLWARSVSKNCACEAMCTHTAVGHDAACRALAWCLLCAWSCSLVSWQDTRSHVV